MSRHREPLGPCDGGSTLPGVALHRPRSSTGEALVLVDNGAGGECVVHVPVCEACCRELHDEPGVRVLVIVRRGG